MPSPSTAPRGLALPALRQVGGYFASKNQYDTAWGDVILAMMTPLGGRPMRRSFGSAVSDTLFDAATGATSTLLERRVTDAISHFVPHVKIISVSVQTNDKVFDVLVEFALREEPSNVVQRVVRIDRRTQMNALAARTR